MDKYLVVINGVTGNHRITVEADSEKNAVATAVGVYCTTALLFGLAPPEMDMTDASGKHAVEAMGLSVGAVDKL